MIDLFFHFYYYQKNPKIKHIVPGPGRQGEVFSFWRVIESTRPGFPHPRARRFGRLGRLVGSAGSAPPRGARVGWPVAVGLQGELSNMQFSLVSYSYSVCRVGLVILLCCVCCYWFHIFQYWVSLCL